MKTYKLMYLLLLFILLGYLYYMFFYPVGFKVKKTNIDIKFQSITINAETAITPAEQTKGLMFREKLDENKGMLFIFQQEAKHTFWMANTKIPLDIIWLDKDKRVIYIEEDVKPCTTIKTLCNTYKPNKNSLYVLEINAGQVKRNNIKIGDVGKFDIY